MFYEEAQISRILNCQRCNQKFDEPRILPCGKTICNNCIYNIENKVLSQSTGDFNCSLCLEQHCVPDSEFPINEVAYNLMSEHPNEVYRSELALTLKSNLNDIQAHLNNLASDLNNGIDKIKEHCIELRREVQLRTEQKILEVNQLNEMLIQQIDDYEEECVQNFTSKKESKRAFDEIIVEINKFLDEKREYLRGFQINDTEIQKSNNIAQILKSKLENGMIYAKSFIFNKKLMLFESSRDRVNKNMLGFFRFKQLGNSMNFNQLKKIQLKNVLNDLSENSLIWTNTFDNGVYFITYLSSRNEMTMATFDPSTNTLEKKVIPNCQVIFNLVKCKNSIALSYFSEQNQNSICIIDSSLNILESISFQDSLFGGTVLIGANDSYLYVNINRGSKSYIKVYDYQLNKVKLTQTFQSTNAQSPFYFPTHIKQLNSRDGKYIWMNSNQICILNEHTGELLKTIQIAADRFELDSKNNLLVLQNSSKKVVYFDLNGVQQKEFDLVGFESNDLTFYIDPNDKLHFFDKKYSKIIYN